jgi:hypothetical protein
MYAGFLTLNAILLAICWGGFGRIYEVLGDREFGPWLRRRKVDAYYNFYIEYIRFTQMIAVFLVASMLIGCVLDGVPELWLRVGLAAVVASSTYAAWWASGCVRIMQELTEYRAVFLERRDDVHPLRKDAAVNAE